MNEWQFFIDVGGTFTDVIARRPDGSTVTRKLLSSGVIRGVVGAQSTPTCIRDPRRTGEPENFWAGYELTVHSHAVVGPAKAIVSSFDSVSGTLSLESSIGWIGRKSTVTPAPAIVGASYELRSHEEAPILAIRELMGLRLTNPIGPVTVRLGTTRATNALLERKGARVALVTTRGFADILKIGYQDRPELFKLNIRKRDELTERVVEIDERLDAKGKVLRAPDLSEVREQLTVAHDAGIETLAICLLHAHVNPDHEEMIAGIAAEFDFQHVSVSSRVCRIERIVPRADTTVVDAYLAPVVRDYVSRLRRSLPQARLHFMTSSGGLTAADTVNGKDTILSGPAGGVVGCAHVARKAGFDRSIAFDMGGTSTDVARIDPPPNEFEYTDETVKAGVRIMTPMIGVDTVAAGGGSICAFDGQKLIVGPQSAGAEPGPACYGRGGPLTVTDMNLHLGRLVPAHFPFSLDRAIVERKLASLVETIRLASEEMNDGEHQLDSIAVAEGFVRIANARMAAAIKKISLARGFDVRTYALNTFGGAGAQHACAIARLLGMSQVLCSPFAGVLSALGIGVADVKRIGQRSVRCSLGQAPQESLKPIFDAMTAELRRELLEDQVDASRLTSPKVSMDLCYAGQSSLITVPAEPFGSARDRFEQLHHQIYGYRHDGRDIEVRIVRVELAARASHLETRATSIVTGNRHGQRLSTQSSPRVTELVIDGQSWQVPLRMRAELGADARFKGPAIVVDETSTIVVEPGWEAVVRENGDIVLTDTDLGSKCEAVSAELDPVQLELFTHQFVATAEQMGATLRRTALSVNVKERLDYSCAIFTPTGDLVVNAPHIPVHLGGMGDCVKSLLEDVSDLQPGDVYMTNDPFRGGSHLNDVTVITPVYDDTGRELLFVVANRAHHAEIGGTKPGSMPPDSTSLAKEGVLIRAFPWIRKNEPRQEALRALLTEAPHPSRTPDENLADVAAQVASNQTGVRELKTMIARYGVSVVHGYMRHIQHAAEQKMRKALRDIPDGVRRFEDQLDDGSKIRLAITIAGEHIALDFRGTDPVLAGNLNANRSIVTSATLYCLRCLIDEDIPLNAGVLAPVDILLPECFLNPPGYDDPKKCAAVVGGNVETSQRVVDCIFGALETVAASQGTMNNLLIGNDRFGYYETICGGAGAGPDFDGADAVHTHMTNTRLTDPEVLESRVPVRLVRFEIRRGSGGQGRHRGGAGVVREIEFLDTLQVSILSQRRTTAPYGVRGGEPGASGRNVLLRHGTDQAEILPSITQIDVRTGDRLTIETPGGGGWGKD